MMFGHSPPSGNTLLPEGGECPNITVVIRLRQSNFSIECLLSQYSDRLLLSGLLNAFNNVLADTNNVILSFLPVIHGLNVRWCHMHDESSAGSLTGSVLTC